ncbi:MAG TPA: cupredoxin family copper-binding protein, partial [Gemmatimonadaceae bacterium]|nr:cupredoxin family copper-binding protein [Gemmatimonadaceae bacterium]
RQSSRKSLTLAPNEIGIDNFKFAPATLTVRAGTKVVWINNDDVPHLIVNVQNKFRQSPVLDSDQRFATTLTKPGTYDYFCSLHPMMQGKIIVT